MQRATKVTHLSLVRPHSVSCQLHSRALLGKERTRMTDARENKSSLDEPGSNLLILPTVLGGII